MSPINPKVFCATWTSQLSTVFHCSFALEGWSDLVQGGSLIRSPPLDSKRHHYDLIDGIERSNGKFTRRYKCTKVIGQITRPPHVPMTLNLAYDHFHQVKWEQYITEETNRRDSRMAWKAETRWDGFR